MEMNLMEKIEKYLGEADRHRQKWADTFTKDGKKGKLIAYWDDLAAYYDFGGTVWSTDGYRWSNKGSTEDFKKKIKAGRIRGKLI